MADRKNSSYRQYIIPDNFIDSGRVINGAFKTRNFVEGVIMGGAAGLLGLLLPISEMTTRVPVVILIAAPFFALGIVGINGDPFSEFVKYAQFWVKSKGVILFNGNTRFLDESPVDAMMQQEDFRDKITEMMEQRRKNKEMEEQNKSFVEGVDFEFDDDEDDLAVVVTPLSQQTAGDLYDDNAPDEPFIISDYEEDDLSEEIASMGSEEFSNVVSLDAGGVGLDALEEDLLGDADSDKSPIIKAQKPEKRSNETVILDGYGETESAGFDEDFDDEGTGETPHKSIADSIAEDTDDDKQEDPIVALDVNDDLSDLDGEDW